MRPRQVVIVSVNRSPELIACLFVVFQCKASYVAIDILYPNSRLNLTIADSNATFYFALKSEKNFTGKVNSLVIDEILDAITNISTEFLKVNIPTDSAAYIIYTFGSTDISKGVQIALCNVINLIYATAVDLEISARDKISVIATISFDFMAMEVFLPLLQRYP